MKESRASPSRAGPFLWARKAAIAVLGTTVLLLGVALIVLPGPAVVVIPLGLAILATEFAWAARALSWLRTRPITERWVRRWKAARGVGARVAIAALALFVCLAASLVGSRF